MKTRTNHPTVSMPSFVSAVLYLALLLPGRTQAASITLYETGFEAPAFTPGLSLRGQDNWEMFHEGEAISISTTNAHTGAQCLRFDGALLEQDGPNNAIAYGFSHALDTLTNNPPPLVEITASVRLDGPQTGTNSTPEQDILSANLMAVVPKPGGQGELLGGFFVSSAGRIWTYSRVEADNYKFSVPYSLGTYRTLKLRIDFIARQTTYLVDGVELGSVPFPLTIAAEHLISGYLFLTGAIEPINTPEITYDLTHYAAYFDDYSLISIPLSPVNAIIEFASTNLLTDEFRPAARLDVVRRGFKDAAVRVTVSTQDVTARAGEDYEAVSTFVTFAAGETNKVVEIPLKDDYWSEPDKAFRVRIAGLPPGATSPKSAARVLIRDDERPGSIDYSWSTTFGLPPLAASQIRYAYPPTYPIPTQPDGRLIVTFEYDVPDANGFPQMQYLRVVRLNADGSRDTSFQPYQSSKYLNAIAQADGKILIAEDAYPRGYRVFRRNNDGTADPTFSATITNKFITFKLLSDGRILAFGESIAVDGHPPQNLVRLNGDCSLDATFAPPATPQFSVGVIPLLDGRVLVPPQYRPTSPPSLTPPMLLNANGSVDDGHTDQ